LPTNIQHSLLYQYARNAAIYHCPADRSTIQSTNGQRLKTLRTRSYTLSQSVNGFADYDPLMSTNLPCFRKMAMITRPGPEICLLFLDEDEDALIDARFGMPTLEVGLPYTWWDLPADRHSQGANLSFADGHAEHWKWRAPKVFYGAGQSVLPPERPDWDRLATTIKQRVN
jgi:prepilin-type processing-associated H-X9-DG protein